MSKPNLMKLVNTCRRGISKHSPEILTGLGIAGMITTTILAVKATPKALYLIEEAEDEKGEELTKTEVVKAAWKSYIPAILTGAASIACVVGASSVNARRNAALATAYSISKTALSEYKEKVIETIGEKKEQVIQEKIAEDKLKKNPASANTIIMTGGGEVRCYDSISGRYFNSDRNTIDAAVNAINRTMTYDMYASLSEFYDELGLEHTDISDDLGWNLDNGLVKIRIDSKIADDGVPCLVLDYNLAPRYDFSKLM